MKLLIIPALLLCIAGHTQMTCEDTHPLSINTNITAAIKRDLQPGASEKDKVQLPKATRWKLNGNRLLTGGLVMLSGAAKGFNETLEFNWHGFAAAFPKANPQWFWPQKSYLNKYKNRDQSQGAKFPLSTSVLVFATDQYHLNNLIFKAGMTAALVIKIGEGKKPFRQYLYDALYYTACYQVGFGSVYYYFKSRVP